MITTRANQHILIIEDDDVDIENIKRCFLKSHINNPVHIANDGYEALCMLQGQDGYNKLNPVPAIILMDINTPRMTGLELLKTLRNEQEFKKINVFVLTTSDSEKDISQAYDLNVAGYFLKPMRSHDLSEVTDALARVWSLQLFPKSN